MAKNIVEQLMCHDPVMRLGSGARGGEGEGGKGGGGGRGGGGGGGRESTAKQVSSWHIRVHTLNLLKFVAVDTVQASLWLDNCNCIQSTGTG